MTDFPRAKEPDSTLALLREGFTFATNRRRALGSDVFRARLMLKPATIAMGADAAEMFYCPGRFTRKRAMPCTVVKMLQDYGSVQTLDGAAHRHRKAMFMNLMGGAAIARLLDLAAEEWRHAAAGWARQDRVELLGAAQLVLCRAILRWAGLSPDEADATARTREFGAMLAGAGQLGVAAWLRGEALRTRNERWARAVVEDIRAGRLSPGTDEAARVIAMHRDAEGQLLPVRIAAIELINILRPTVAVAYFIVHAALALHQHPDWRECLRAAGDTELESFVQEVRRLAPFFPVIAGRVREPFEWRGARFGQGDWVVLDIYGTNRDPRTWHDPDSFRPERFADWDGSPWSFIPQGGGPFLQGHRCPGEWITIALVKQAARFLARDLDYAVPEQDLGVDLSRIPAIPASRFQMQIRGLREG